MINGGRRGWEHAEKLKGLSSANADLALHADRPSRFESCPTELLGEVSHSRHLANKGAVLLVSSEP